MKKSFLNIRYISWHNFLLDFRFYDPILILYFTKIAGSYSGGMAVYSIIFLCSAVFEVPTGIFSDLIGRRNTLILGSIATLFSVFFYAIANTYSILVLGAILEGLARSFYSGNNDSLLHDSLRENKLVNDYIHHKGITDSSSQLALAIVAIIGGLIAFFSFKLVLWLSILPAILGLLVSFKIIEPGLITKEKGDIFSHLKEALLLFWKNKKLRLLSLGGMIGFAQSESGYQFRSAFYQTLWPIWAIGIVKALGNLGASASFYWAGRIVKKFGEFQTVLISKVYSISTNIISTLFPSIISPVLMSSNSLFYGSGSTASNSLKQREYSNEQRATMASLDSLGGSIMFAIVSYSIGLVADKLTPAKGLLYLQVLAAISTFITFYLFRKESKNKTVKNFR